MSAAAEIAGLTLDQIEVLDPVAADPDQPASPLVACIALRLGRTKTTDAADDMRVFLIGPAADALKAWLDCARIAAGPVFRAVAKGGRIQHRALDPASVTLIIKRRVARARLDPNDFSAHGLRSGFITEAALQGLSLPEAMAQSGHRSVQQAARYFNEAERRMGRAARLVR